MTVIIGRRELLTALGGAAAAWPLAARAQQRGRTPRVGILMPLTPDDSYEQARLAAFLQGLQESEWGVGRNLRIDTRWGGGNIDRIRRSAMELVALGPDVILAIGTNSAVALHQASRTMPVVFTAVTDPVGAGLVESLARPGGNMTGFTFFGFGTGTKWLELLKEIAPGVRRAAVLRDTSPNGIGVFGPGSRTVTRSRYESSRCGGRRRDRAGHYRIRALPEWRAYCDTECDDDRSSRTDHLAGGSVPATGSVRLPLVCQQWWLDLLRT